MVLTYRSQSQTAFKEPVALICIINEFFNFVVLLCQNWERCETGLADSMLQLKDMKTRLNQSMPECDDELQSAEKFNKVHLQIAGHTSTNQNMQHITYC